MSGVYLDHCAGTPLHPEARRAMQHWLDGAAFGNAASIHGVGRVQEAALSQARAQLAALLSVRTPELVLTSSGTEAANLAVLGAAEQLRRAGKGHRIVTTAIEHECVLDACKQLEARGFDVVRLPISEEGEVDPGAVEAAIVPGTVLVSVMLANHETGCILPVRRLARRAHAVGALCHTNAAIAVGRMPVDPQALEVNLLSCSSRKSYGPSGAGALYVRRGISLFPQLFGGPQERKRRPGAENIVGFVGWGAACQALRGELKEAGEGTEQLRERLERLTRLLWEGLRSQLQGVTLNTPLESPFRAVPGVLNVSFDGVEGESLLMNLDIQGISVSSGAPCSSGSLEPAPVLLALGYSEARARSAVRFSLGRSTDEAELSRVLERLPPVVERLRAVRVRSRGQQLQKG